MVPVKMLMDIALPKMVELLVMTMVMISPSLKEVFPAEQLRQSPRLIPPRFPPRGGGVSSRKLAHEFFQDKTLHIAEDGHRRATRGPKRQGACSVGVGAPHPHG